MLSAFFGISLSTYTGPLSYSEEAGVRIIVRLPYSVFGCAFVVPRDCSRLSEPCQFNIRSFVFLGAYPSYVFHIYVVRNSEMKLCTYTSVCLHDPFNLPLVPV